MAKIPGVFVPKPIQHSLGCVHWCAPILISLAFADAVDLIDKEKADLAEIQALRTRTMTALSTKVGTVISLKKGTLTGTIKAEPNKDGVTIVLKDGPELMLTTSQFDVDDVCNFDWRRT